MWVGQGPDHHMMGRNGVHRLDCGIGPLVRPLVVTSDPAGRLPAPAQQPPTYF
jgi:hypothetical protein